MNTDYLIRQARLMGADGLWLESNNVLDAALRLHQRNGFTRLLADELWPTPYARCDIQMVRKL